MQRHKCTMSQFSEKDEIYYQEVELKGSDIYICDRCGMVFMPAPMNNCSAYSVHGIDPIYCPLCKSFVATKGVIK